MIEDAYLAGEAMGLEVWCTDQAGPFQTVPHPGPSWRPEGEPARQPHEYLRDGTAKLLTLFHPASGRVRVEGVTSCPNTVLHGWLRRELAAVLAAMPPAAGPSPRGDWERWQEGLTIKPTLLSESAAAADAPGPRQPRRPQDAGVRLAGCSRTGSCRCTRRWAGRG